jgi:hypothetical protein
MYIRALTYILVFIISLARSQAQEVVTGLYTNRQVKEIWDKQEKTKGLNTTDTLELPFFDDFSTTTVLPDSGKWQDNFVFVNNTYSIDQITSGIATFDAIDNTGQIYNDATPAGFLADHLTSHHINLNYQSSDNIFLSFFYQPAGIADAPEEKDSLTLQFYAPEESKWHSIWKVTGSESHRFKPVIIRIADERFLKKGFRFRFSNYASLSPDLSDPSIVGNCDHWNIDYILLNRNRTDSDTIPPDVAMTLPVRSVLKTHEAMPWKQFRQVYLQEMGSAIRIYYRNNDRIVRNVTRNFEIWDEYNNSLSYAFTAGATNVDPGAEIEYNANLIYNFPSGEKDSALFRITSYLITDIFDQKANDTLTYYQNFGSYFAYDDGSSESGYGINGLGSRNAMAACRFRSFIEDTIRAVNICFNDSYENSNQRTFDLMIWDDNNGKPGNIIYSQEEATVTPGIMINGFHNYLLKTPVIVTGDFYVGWRQRSETFLNAGFDLNTSSAGKLFYWLNGNWIQSQANGSLMIRPVMKVPAKSTGIHDVRPYNNKLIKIWPNPAKEFIFLGAGEMNPSEDWSVTISDLQGRTVMMIPYREMIDISSLSEGIYFVITAINNRPAGINRIIKTR